MYAVIFTAQVKAIDDDYHKTASRMRQLAVEHYGCLNFVSSVQGNQEIAISYWHDENAIKRWKQDPEHQQAQQLGQQRWYSRYTVEVVEIRRHYCHEEPESG